GCGGVRGGGGRGVGVRRGPGARRPGACLFGAFLSGGFLSGALRFGVLGRGGDVGCRFRAVGRRLRPLRGRGVRLRGGAGRLAGRSRLRGRALLPVARPGRARTAGARRGGRRGSAVAAGAPAGRRGAEPAAVEFEAFLGARPAQRGEAFDGGEVDRHRLTGAVAVQGGGVHAEAAGQRAVAAVRPFLQLPEQRREAGHLVLAAALCRHRHPASRRLTFTRSRGPRAWNGIPGTPYICTSDGLGWFHARRNATAACTGRPGRPMLMAPGRAAPTATGRTAPAVAVTPVRAHHGDPTVPAPRAAVISVDPRTPYGG